MNNNDKKATQRVCLKTSSLRKFTRCDNVKQWLMQSANNVYCAREQRVFINTLQTKSDFGGTLSNGSYVHKSNGFVQERFVIPCSVWHNPFPVDKADPNDREASLRLFDDYLESRLNANPEMKTELQRLCGKNLGCWCDLKLPCHVDILIAKINCV